MNKETLKSYLEEYKNKEQEIKEYDTLIKKLENEKAEKVRELENYGKDKEISIPLNKLLTEIDKLTETNTNNITVNLQIPIIEIGTITNKDEFIELLKKKHVFSILEIYGDYVDQDILYKYFPHNCEFYYSLNMRCDLDEICEDGKKFSDKFELVNFSSCYEDIKVYTRLELKKNEDISGVICHLHLNDFARSIAKGVNHPNNLLKQAVLNYVNKELEKPKTKKLSK